MQIPISKIHPNPDQPRKHFDPDELAAVAATMRQHGVLQPITVFEVEGEYILEDGERRVRAAKLAGLAEVPARILPPKPGGYDSLVRAAIANIQRARLTPSEEGHTFKRLQDERGWRVAQIAAEFGLCEPTVKNRLAVARLDEPIQQWIDQGRLPSDQRVVEALLAIPDAQMRLALAGKLAERKAAIKVCLAACTKLNAPKPKARTASRIARSTPAEGQARWNAFSQAGQLPPWPMFNRAVAAACEKTCTLAGEADGAVCKDCPMALMVVGLIEAAAAGAKPAWPVKEGCSNRASARP